MTIFYVSCHRPTTTLLLYPDLGQAVNGAQAVNSERCIRPTTILFLICVCVCKRALLPNKLSLMCHFSLIFQMEYYLCSVSLFLPVSLFVIKLKSSIICRSNFGDLHLKVVTSSRILKLSFQVSQCSIIGMYVTYCGS